MTGRTSARRPSDAGALKASQKSWQVRQPLERNTSSVRWATPAMATLVGSPLGSTPTRSSTSFDAPSPRGSDTPGRTWNDGDVERERAPPAPCSCELPSSPMPSSWRSEEHTSELQSLMRISYAVFCLKKKKLKHKHQTQNHTHIHQQQQ